MITASITMLQFWVYVLIALLSIAAIYTFFEYVLDLHQVRFPADENKYRIKEVNLMNGNKYYEIQYKVGLFWRSYKHPLFDEGYGYTRHSYVEKFNYLAESRDKIHELIDKEIAKQGNKKDYITYYKNFHKRNDTQ